LGRERDAYPREGIVIACSYWNECHLLQQKRKEHLLLGTGVRDRLAVPEIGKRFPSGAGRNLAMALKEGVIEVSEE